MEPPGGAGASRTGSCASPGPGRQQPVNAGDPLASTSTRSPLPSYLAYGKLWVPYKSIQGMTVYQYNDSDAYSGMGGEYMASSAVRGSPARVLEVLTGDGCNATVLGPASLVELLERRRDEEGCTREVVRLVLEAPGWSGRMCAAREMLVERTIKTEQSLHVVMFNSLYREGQPTRAYRSRSLYPQPVQGRARGTYAIAPLEGHSLESSPETLICYIIKVDLRGVCGDGSCLRPVSDALGWTDAFLDRMLTAPLLVRDEVEHSRFTIKPQALLNLPRLATLEVARRLSVPEASGAAHSPLSAHAHHAHSPRLPAPAPGPMQGRGLITRLRSSLTRRTSALALLPPLLGMAPGLKGSEPPAAAVVQRPSSTSTSSDVGASPVEEHGAGPWSEGGAGGAASGVYRLDLEYMRSLALLEPHFWEAIHAPGKASPFKVRGRRYMSDRKKFPAGMTAYQLAAIDVISTPHVVEHVARFLPAVRDGHAPFAFVINLIIPGTPLLGIVSTFASDVHPDQLGPAPVDPMQGHHSWRPFDFVLHKFIHGDTATRNHMLKLIPHIADGSWVVKQSVGTKPVITGKALKTMYHLTKHYMEIDIDISANQVASYVTGLVRGATRSLVIDIGFVLEGIQPWELPEQLLGAIRVNYLDLSFAKPLDTSEEKGPQPRPDMDPSADAGAGAGAGTGAGAGAGAGTGASAGASASAGTGASTGTGAGTGAGAGAGAAAAFQVQENPLWDET